MFKKAMRAGLLVTVLLVTGFLANSAIAVAQEEALEVFFFGRDDCGFCKEQKDWMEEQGIDYTYLNIVESEESNRLWQAVAEKHEATKVTPITVVGEKVFVGFNGPDTTGVSIKEALQQETNINSVAEHLEKAPVLSVDEAAGCTNEECDAAEAMAYVFDLPLLGLTDLKSFSLFTMSAVLGTIDGFNPCAMWVLITFLVLLSQAGSKKKMVLLAGIFILAEAVMYNLILNVWYKTWDFVALDQIVTPIVGFVALAGGLFFIYRWHKNKGVALVCDVSNLETQAKTMAKFQKIAKEPVTVATFLAILLIAFSVNIIEFACSVGIPQAYTKILDLNMLTFMERQWYILVYTIGYMVDDFIVFGLAIWGYSHLEAHGHKYSQASLIVGGVLMILLGAILVFNPSLLVL